IDYAAGGVIVLRTRLRLRLLFLHEYRHKESEEALQKFLRSCVIQSIIVFLLVGLLAALGELPLWLTVFMFLLPILYPLLLVKRLDQQIAKIKLSFLLELPLFVNKLLLLLQSGLTLHASFQRVAAS